VTENGSNFWTIAIAYDAVGRITNRIELMNGSNSVSAYAYDLAGRLSLVWINGVLSTTYTYDTNGDRLTRNLVTATYDAQDRVLTSGGTTFGWSPNGTLLTASESGLTTNYTYDARGALTEVALPNGTQIQYLIDGIGRRVGKMVGGVLRRGWLWDGLEPVAEIDSNSAVSLRFIYAADDNTPSVMLKGSNTYRIFCDERHSPRLIVNAADGTVAQQLNYDEYGRVIQDTSPGFQPFGFGSGIYDPDTGLVRLGARDYCAQTGHWTSRDPFLFQGGSLNFYAYVDSDPVNETDVVGTGPGTLHLPSFFGGDLRSRNADVSAVINANQHASDNPLRNALNNANGTVKDGLNTALTLTQKGQEFVADLPAASIGIASEGVSHEAAVTTANEDYKGTVDWISDKYKEWQEEREKAAQAAENEAHPFGPAFGKLSE
jgi:RHS repeat-associated protein